MRFIDNFYIYLYIIEATISQVFIMSFNIYEENAVGPVPAAEEPKPSVEPKEVPASQPAPAEKPKKKKVGLGVAFSLISFVFGIICLAAEVCGIGGWALLAALFSGAELPQELENIAYGLSGKGMIIGVLALLDLLFVIIAIVFAAVAKKKTDAPKFMSVLSLIISILAIVFYVLLIVAIVVSAVVVINGAGLMDMISGLLGGGAA